MRSPPTSLLLVSFFLHLLFLSPRGAHSQILCIEKEKQALLDFKLSFVNFNLSSWSIHNDDCCTWHGVGCDVHTGHVTSLQLYEVDGYKLRPSLLELQHLTFLEIWYTLDQLSIRIPKFIGSLSELTDLVLYGFSGEIPPHLGNLSRLQSLHLGPSSNDCLYAHNLKWLSRLSSLEILFLSGTNLTNAIDWASTIKMLPTLSEFECRYCSLPPPILSSTYHANFSTTLQTLDLSKNILSSSTVSYLINTSNNLQTLFLDRTNLGHNNYHKFLESLTDKARYSLMELSLVGNDLKSLPFEGMMFPSLMYLDASSNQIKGSLLEILQYLSPNLTHLDVSSNVLSGTILGAHFSNFSKLVLLKLSDNLLTVNFSESWEPPFLLVNLGLSSCKVGPSFPTWILKQNSLAMLDMSNNKISGSIPDAFLNFTDLTGFNLSHNKISCFPDFNLSSPPWFPTLIDLSYNSFDGPIPLALFKSAIILNLSNNKFSNFPTFHQPSPTFSRVQWVIDLSNNNLSSSLPNWLVTGLIRVVNLENNKLSGRIHLPRVRLLAITTANRNLFKALKDMSSRETLIVEKSFNQVVREEEEALPWKHLQKLHKLSLGFEETFSMRSNQRLLHGIEDLTSLKEVTLRKRKELYLSWRALLDLPHLQDLSIAVVEKVVEVESDPVMIQTQPISHSIQRLTISGCLGEWVNDIPWKSFPFLKHLSLLRMRNSSPSNPTMEGLPEGIQHLAALKSFYIFDIKEVVSLPHWMSSLSSLENLDIWQSSFRTKEAMRNINRRRLA